MLAVIASLEKRVSDMHCLGLSAFSAVMPCVD
jgi:hypothetical protein